MTYLESQSGKGLTQTPKGPGAQTLTSDLWKPTGSELRSSSPEGILLSRGQITREQLESAQRQQKEDPRLSVLEILRRTAAIDESAALQAIAEHCRLPFRRIVSDDVSPEAFALLPMEYLIAKSILPLQVEQGAIMMAISDPTDIFLVDDIKRRLKLRVRLVVSTPSDIRKSIDAMAAGPGEHVDEIVRDFDEGSVSVVDEKSEEEKDLARIAGESPVIRYVNYLISSAVHNRASDIHIEPSSKRIRVRFRMDGMLFEQPSPSAQMHAAIISRLKIMAKLDIAERRLPQDGRIRATVGGQTIDLRVSILPAAHGEKCVIRLLDARAISIGLENLGFAPDMLRDFREQVLQPHGIVLVTGPTGSGKSTTLYSALKIMDSERMNISTVEDPVEYELSTITQVGVKDSIGMTFAAALRSLLRQDPDVIMVGEIRDPETARIAVQASLTGHMVLSTLHTNDAPSSITRLINIGVEPYLISASLNAILAQRLVRRVCPACKQENAPLSPQEAAYLEAHHVSGIFNSRGAGCDKCRRTGYKGRVGIYELLVLDEQLRVIIGRSPSVMDVREYARQKGMRSLQQDGLDKVNRGLTTVEEIMRVTEV